MVKVLVDSGGLRAVTPKNSHVKWHSRPIWHTFKRTSDGVCDFINKKIFIHVGEQ